MKPSSIAMGTAFLGTVFILAPVGAVQLNETCDWPRLQVSMGTVVGIGLMAAGIAVAAYCAGLFSRLGRGTPVPVEPPKRLVIAGLYRYSRNPMYVAHVAILLGVFLYRGELALLLYTAVYAGAIHAWVVWGEEPQLRQRFGEEYIRYTQEVSRWLPIRLRGFHR